ncbi:hypothetical protein RHGRI_031416 [Rhododendron griersonianum]|uniref:Uncharacterized protein n=1 Tax=Rhododendron griersonianum TaxID=479676 RepID=A0AAV6IDJ9_9ERIC|nr:hypothetical protein RHGRI_031416 [Rhododendron griersonianum]
MAPRNIIADLEERKKKKMKQEPRRREKPILRLVDQRPFSSSSQDKDLPKDARLEKKQRIDTGSGGEGETTKRKGVSGTAVPWCPLFVTPAPEKRQITNEDSLAADPSIARVLYHGLALLKDITKPASLKSAIDDHYFHAG